MKEKKNTEIWSEFTFVPPASHALTVVNGRKPEIVMTVTGVCWFDLVLAT